MVAPILVVTAMAGDCGCSILVVVVVLILVGAAVVGGCGCSMVVVVVL